MADERIEVQRTIEAAPADVFAVLADPQGHVAIDASGMLMGATGAPVAAVGDEFVVHMDREVAQRLPARAVRRDRTDLHVRARS